MSNKVTVTMREQITLGDQVLAAGKSYEVSKRDARSITRRGWGYIKSAHVSETSGDIKPKEVDGDDGQATDIKPTTKPKKTK